MGSQSPRDSLMSAQLRFRVNQYSPVPPSQVLRPRVTGSKLLKIDFSTLNYSSEIVA